MIIGQIILDSHPIHSDGFGLTVIRFLGDFDLFSQIRDEFGTGSSIAILILS